MEYKAPYYKKVETSLSEEVNKNRFSYIINKDNSEFVAKVNINPTDYDYDSVPNVKGWEKTFEMKTNLFKFAQTLLLAKWGRTYKDMVLYNVNNGNMADFIDIT